MRVGACVCVCKLESINNSLIHTLRYTHTYVCTYVCTSQPEIRSVLFIHTHNLIHTYNVTSQLLFLCRLPTYHQLIKFKSNQIKSNHHIKYHKQNQKPQNHVLSFAPRLQQPTAYHIIQIKLFIAIANFKMNIHDTYVHKLFTYAKLFVVFVCQR